MATEEKTKICKCCGKELPLSEFYIHRTNRDGHKTICKKCDSKEQKAKYAERKGKFIPQQETKEKTKICACCGEELPLSEFYVQGGSKDGHRSFCKKCYNEAQKEKRAKLVRNTNSQLETKDILGIADFSDSMLVAELRRRGYTGELRFSKTVAI